jgi:hypothetical protein
VADGGAWAAVGAAGGWIGGIVTQWLIYRGKQQETSVAHDTAAWEGYDELVRNQREDIHLLRSEVAELRAEVADCHQEREAQSEVLERYKADLVDLREDLQVLRKTVVAQINLEARKDE